MRERPIPNTDGESSTTAMSASTPAPLRPDSRSTTTSTTTTGTTSTTTTTNNNNKRNSGSGSGSGSGNTGTTVGQLLADIATALQDTLRSLMFADKRGWGPDEFEQIRAIEEALDEAKRDFQTMGPLVNGQFYYENDRRAESLAELGALRGHFEDHAQLFRDWIRSGGPINPLWVRETIYLRRQLHRAQCRTARRIFNAEHETGDGSGSGARCLGAFLVYRRFREQTELQKQYARRHQAQGRTDVNGDSKFADQKRASTISTMPATSTTTTRPGTNFSEAPAWKQQQPHLRAREQRQFAGQERFRGRTGYNDSHSSAAYTDETVAIEMTPQSTTTPPSIPNTRPLVKSALKASHTASHTALQTSIQTTTSQTTPQTTPQHPPQHTPQLLQRQVSRNGLPPPIPLPIAPSARAPISSVSKPSFESAQITIPLDPDEPPSPPPKPPSLEDLVPYCNAVGTFERFGDRDIAFICDYCDGHIVWPDIQRLPTTRTPPAAISASTAATAGLSSSSSFSSHLPYPVTTNMPNAAPLSSLRRASPLPPFATSSQAAAASYSMPVDSEDSDEYPRWQASTVAMSDPSTPRTVVFAPLAIANHLAPMVGDWEARLWCPYCDTYLYYDSGEGDQTKYAQDENGFPSLTDFQLHLEWHHTALPIPPLPSVPSTCSVM